MYAELYKDLIGAESTPLRHRITAEEIHRFAAAIGDMSPLYHDEAYAKTTEYGGIIAPPTFSVILEFANVEGVWKAPMGAIHAAQEFRYEKPLYAGREYICINRLKDVYEKNGRNGINVFMEQEKSVYDTDMNFCTSFIITTITRGSLYEEFYRPDWQEKNCTSETGAKEVRSGYHFAELEEGMALPEIVLPEFDRVTITKYAGAASDFNPIHIDDEAAQKVNFKKVIAHGLLSVAMETKVLNCWFGEPEKYKLLNLKTKFVNPAYVGDVPVFNARISKLCAEKQQLELSYQMDAANGTIISGTAEILLK